MHFTLRAGLLSFSANLNRRVTMQTLIQQVLGAAEPLHFPQGHADTLAQGPPHSRISVTAVGAPGLLRTNTSLGGPAPHPSPSQGLGPNAGRLRLVFACSEHLRPNTLPTWGAEGIPRGTEEKQTVAEGQPMVLPQPQAGSV